MEVIEYGLVKPVWADEQFAKWLTSHCPTTYTTPVIMPNKMCIDGGEWVQEQFRKQTFVPPNTESAQEMFAALVSIYITTQLPQQDIFRQIFEAYLRNLPAKA